MQRRGPTNLNLSIFVCSFDVCRALYPFPFINYGLQQTLAFTTLMFFFFALLIQPKTLAVNGTPRIAPASLWTRPKVQEFIQHVKSDPSSVLVVGRGETMTVRVPTHEGGE